MDDNFTFLTRNAIITLTMHISHKLSYVMSFPPSLPHRWESWERRWLKWDVGTVVALRKEKQCLFSAATLQERHVRGWKRILRVKRLQLVADNTATPTSVRCCMSARLARRDRNNQSAKCLFWSRVWKGSTKERMNCVPIVTVRCLAQAESGRYLQFCWPFTEICFCVISAWMGDIKFAKIIEPIGAETLLTPFWRRRVGAPNKGAVCFKKEWKNERMEKNTHSHSTTHKFREKKNSFQSNNALSK